MPLAVLLNTELSSNMNSVNYSADINSVYSRLDILRYLDKMPLVV